MPRRRRRRTNRRPQEERRLRVRGIRRGVPDEKKLSRAFIGLALARAEADAQAQSELTPRSADIAQADSAVNGKNDNGTA
jgi:hypothetical protein